MAETFVPLQSKITADWGNKIERTVQDGLGANTSPEHIRVFLEAIQEAPNDGVQYARRDLGWSPIVGASGDMTKAEYDTNAEVGIVDKALTLDDNAGNAITAAEGRTHLDTANIHMPMDDAQSVNTVLWSAARILQELSNYYNAAGGVLQSYGEKLVTLGALGDIDTANGNVFDCTPTADLTMTFVTAYQCTSFTLFLNGVKTGGHTITWPTSVQWPDNLPPTLDDDDLLTFITKDGGTSWRGVFNASNFGGSAG